MKKLCACLFAFAFLFTAGQTNAGAAADRDCGEFASQQEVMKFWHDNGYSASNDPHDLDRDNDGLPCEVSQSDYDSFLATTDDSKEDTTTDDSTEDVVSDSNDNSNTDNSSNEDSDSTTSDSDKEGEELPDTASNAVTMVGLSAVLLAAGSILVFRKKQVN
jgi:LPXTG-motif cell wall-anchored protein